LFTLEKRRLRWILLIVQVPDGRVKRRWSQTVLSGALCQGKRQWAQTETLENPFRHKKNCLTVRVVKHRNRLPKKVVGSLVLEILKIQVNIAWNNLLSRSPCFQCGGGGAKLDDFQKRLPASMIL